MRYNPDWIFGVKTGWLVFWGWLIVCGAGILLGLWGVSEGGGGDWGPDRVFVR